MTVINCCFSLSPLRITDHHFVWQQKKMERHQCSLIFVRLKSRRDCKCALQIFAWECAWQKFTGASAEKSLVTRPWQKKNGKKHCHTLLSKRRNSSSCCGFILSMASTTSFRKNIDPCTISLYFCIFLSNFCFFWLWSTSPFLRLSACFYLGGNTNADISSIGKKNLAHFGYFTSADIYSIFSGISAH